MRTIVQKLGLILIFGLLVAVVGLISVNAQFSDFDKKAIDSEFEWLPEFTDTLCDVSSGSTIVVGNNNAERAYNFFRIKGLTAIQSAAILGNLHVESGLDPTIKEGGEHFSTIAEIQSGGYGLAQWTHPSRKEKWIAFTESRGWADQIATLLPQLEWIWEEWASHPDYGREEFFSANENDLRQLTWIFNSYYERPGSIEGHYATTVQPTSGSALDSHNARYDAAQAYLETFGDNIVSERSSSICVTGADNADFSTSGLRVDGSPPWVGTYLGQCRTSGTTNCSSGFTAGARALEDFVLDTWSPPVTGVGGFCCRPIRGESSLTSVHGTGRALDIYIDATDPAELQVGNQIRNWMISHSLDAGIQRVIWNRHSWVADRDGWVDYCRGGCTDEGGGRSPHEDHLHVEINNDAANMILPWYQGR